jgi:hypothetical protein
MRLAELEMTWALANSFSSYSSLSWPLMRTLLGWAYLRQPGRSHVCVLARPCLHQNWNKLFRIGVCYSGNAAKSVLPEHSP